MAMQIDREKLLRPRGPGEVRSDVLSYILVPGADMADAVQAMIDEGFKVYDNPFRPPLQDVSMSKFLFSGYLLKVYFNEDIVLSTMRWNDFNINAYFDANANRCFMWDEISIPDTIDEIDISQFL